MIAALIGGVAMSDEMARPRARCKLMRSRLLCYCATMHFLQMAAASLLLAACVADGGLVAPLAGRAPTETQYDVPYVPTPAALVEAMLDLAEVGEGDHLADLGSGDGRIAIAAARRGATALGIEIDPDLVARASAYARGEGLEDRVRFRRADLFQAPIGEASVVTLYLLPNVNLRLRPRLLTELRPGTRVVSHAFHMGDWRAEETRELDGRRYYMWIVPAAAGGRWQVTLPQGRHGLLEIEQRFQDVSATLDGRPVEAELRGDRLSLSAGGDPLDGRVGDTEIVGDGWRARRLP
jgi:SAM-dependent methyltransferase